MKNLIKNVGFCVAFIVLSGCFGGLRTLNVKDFTEQRVTDLSLTKKVTGKREFIFFSTTKMGVFLEGNVQGIITDYQGNPIEGVTIKIMPESAKDKSGEADAFASAGDNANSYINLSFSPGISDSMGLYKIHFSLPLTDNEVDLKGKLVYNPGWDQQKMNLGKAYEPQTKETPFRLYYSMKTGFLAFAEGVRKMVVQPVGEGTGRLNVLPGAKAPVAKPKAEAAPAAGKAEEDLFKGFDFGQ
ncbi:MAG: hypothetical protein A2X34_00175 [Elusimicrobia bacterium GWC2_51_8]|nr:MAG: hypothetical protein A2X34_00175 [Elusimicrobia bacterium GWC2_51_8]OGR85844.1 MAG: hypothetical protein A2021_01750 [Elusimicrobia bacterium GWF2_52_66]